MDETIKQDGLMLKQVFITAKQVVEKAILGRISHFWKLK